MAIMFVFIKCKPGKEFMVKNELQKIPYVTRVGVTMGEYDLIVQLTADTTEKLQNIFLTKIKGLGNTNQKILLSGTITPY